MVAIAKNHYYKPEYCPKDSPVKNIEWRLRWWEKCMTDKGLQKSFRQAAFEDVLFWFNAFCWCFEPRSAVKVRPFCTWNIQDPAIVTADNAITQAEITEQPTNVVWDKSRGQGATWMYLMIFLRRWLREPMFSAGLVTRNEKLVDSARDPDTLMWKIVWMLGRLPYWMLPEGFDITKHRNLTEHSLLNPENGSSIVGYSATGDVARGGRKTVFAMDELAAFKPGEDYAALNSTSQVTYCRFLVSTFLGDHGAFYDAATQPGDAIKIILDWRDNEALNRCLYRVVNGRIWEVDPKPGNRLGPSDFAVIKEQHAKLRKRGYVIENKIRNIWYNRQCLQPGMTPKAIAEELDRDPHGSVSKVFSSEAIKKAKTRYAIPPALQGKLIWDPETAKVRAPFVAEGEEGELRLWVKPDEFTGMMPPGSYALGADISAGSGGDYTSNSVASVINKLTGEQVCEWTSNTTSPRKFAFLCVALARWFHDAEIIPEANFSAGYMGVLTDELVYPNLYYREVEIEGLHEKTNKPGFWMGNDDIKAKVFEAMQEGMVVESFVPRSAEMLDECMEYEWRNGKIVHIGATKTDDGASKGKAHGDRVIASALAWFGCGLLGARSEDETEETKPAPVGSMAHRLKVYDEEHLTTEADPWEDGYLDVFCGSASYSRDRWS